MAMHEIEVWVCVDGPGDYEVGKDQESASENYRENITEDAAGTRMVCIKLNVEVPEPLTIAATIPAREGKVSMTVAG